MYVNCSTTFLISDCKDQFAVKFSHNAEGADGQSGIETRMDCAAKCVSMPDCVAFDFDSSAKPWKDIRCWIHDGGNLEVKSQANVDHYTRDLCTPKMRKLTRIHTLYQTIQLLFTFIIFLVLPPFPTSYTI